MENLESERPQVLTREDVNPPSPEHLQREAEDFRNMHIRQAHTFLYEVMKEILKWNENKI